MSFFIKLLIAIYSLLPVTAIIYEKGYLIPFLALLISVLISTAGILIHKNKYFKDQLLMILILRFLTFLMGFMFLLKFIQWTVKSIEKWSKNIITETFLVYSVVVLIILTFIFIMGDYLVKQVNTVKDPRKENGIINKFEAYVTLIGALLAPFVLPNIVFGFSYSLILSAFYKIELSGLEPYYLSFIINYALPINNEVLSNCINKINSDLLLNLLQIAHITITKIIELSIIAVVIKYINNLIIKSD